MPVDIHIDLENITGPSAGMMFALGIIDRMTPGDITGGQKIAGTGTVSYDGQIGPIGGIQQKMRGAVRDGAMWFLAPQMNCSEVIGHIPEGLHVFSVSTLSEAKAAVEAIASGRTQQLPTCQAP
nr:MULTISPECIES: S16 family serine protease [unclassified Schaalia]